MEYADPHFEAQVQALKPVISALFAVLVDKPLQTPLQAKNAASNIALAICDAFVPAAHYAYSEVSRERQRNGQMTGSSEL